MAGVRAKPAARSGFGASGAGAAATLELEAGADHSWSLLAPLKLKPSAATEVIRPEPPEALTALVSPKESLPAVLSFESELACAAELTIEVLAAPLTALS